MHVSKIDNVVLAPEVSLPNKSSSSSSSSSPGPRAQDHHLSSARHQYLFHPGQPKQLQPGSSSLHPTRGSGPLSLSTNAMDQPSFSSSKMATQRVQLPPLFHPNGLPPLPSGSSSSRISSVHHSLTTGSTSIATTRFNRDSSLELDPTTSFHPAGKGRPSTHPRPTGHYHPSRTEMASSTDGPSRFSPPRARPKTQPGGGPGPRTTEIRARSTRTTVNALDAGVRRGKVDEGELSSDRRRKSSTVLVDGLDVRDILQTYRALRDRLPDVFPGKSSVPATFGAGEIDSKQAMTTKTVRGQRDPLHTVEPSESIDELEEQDEETGAAGSAIDEREELREILRLAMDGFKLVGSVFANKSHSARQAEMRRPATEPSGLGRRYDAGHGSFSRDNGLGSRSLEWDDPSEMSSPGGMTIGDTSTVKGPASGFSAQGLGVPSSSASTTPVSHIDHTPSIGPQDLPNRAPSGSSSQSTKMDVDLPLSSPLEDGFGDRPGSSAANGQGAVAANPVCLGCGATETPEWRRGPMGPRTLCNACGLVFAKLVRKRAREAAKAQAIAKGLLPPKKARGGKKAKVPVVVEETNA